MSSFFRVISLVFFFSVEAFAESKSVADFFGGAPALDLSAIYLRTSAEYAALNTCRNTSPPGSGCSPGIARLYEFSSSANLVDSFDLVNRCVALRGSQKVVLGPPTLDPVLQTVSCNPAPEEIAVLHLVACYESAAGAVCDLATLCFGGANRRGVCTRDYPRESIPLRPLN
jgi:hypothetical protein